MSVTYLSEDDDETLIGVLGIRREISFRAHSGASVAAIRHRPEFKELVERLADDDPIVIETPTPEALEAPQLLDLARDRGKRVVVRSLKT
jgi:hypothetical protein